MENVSFASLGEVVQILYFPWGYTNSKTVDSVMILNVSVADKQLSFSA